jgi:hypothetical protein
MDSFDVALAFQYGNPVARRSDVHAHVTGNGVIAACQSACLAVSVKDAVDEEHKGTAHGFHVSGMAIHDQTAPYWSPPVLRLCWFNGSRHRHGLEVSQLLDQCRGVTADRYQVRWGNRLRFE